MEEDYDNMLKNPKSYESCEIESYILYLEELKDENRMVNQQNFEKYDIMQEELYQILETHFDIKYKNIPDKWNK